MCVYIFAHCIYHVEGACLLKPAMRPATGTSAGDYISVHIKYYIYIYNIIIIYIYNWTGVHLLKPAMRPATGTCKGRGNNEARQTEKYDINYSVNLYLNNLCLFMAQ